MSRRTLFLEPVGGISGDMFLAAAIDLGADLAELIALLGDIGLRGFKINSERVAQHALMGTRVTVTSSEGPTIRPWKEIHALLGRLPDAVAPRAIGVFSRLAEVEARIHGVSVDEVHFHELGGIDSIVDLVGAAWAVSALGVEEIFSRPPPLGSGMVQGQHGPLPVPAPATLELLRGVPVLLEGQGEMTTPTGAAILSTWASVALPPCLNISRIGYGLGHASWSDRPNLLRASLGESSAPRASTRMVSVLEAHLDDATPQLFAHVLEELMAAGALDAGLTPMLMKKGRPGQRLTVVCEPAMRATLAERILRLSPTLGVRCTTAERDELAREMATVRTEFGEVRVKVGRLGDEVVNVAPEYEDCAELARRTGVPLKRVLGAAIRAADQLWSASRS
jgi:uncharacterized protein (TIGR00299 family) protein